MKFITQYQYKPQAGELNSGEIVTIPDEALTIEQLFQKAVQGTMPVSDNGLTYDEREINADDQFFNHLSTLNLQDPIDRLQALDYIEDYKVYLESQSSKTSQKFKTSDNEVVEETKERSESVSETKDDNTTLPI